MKDLITILFFCTFFTSLFVAPIGLIIWVKQRRKKNILAFTFKGVFTFIAVIIILLVGCGFLTVATEYVMDRLDYGLGHQAYLTNQCEEAILHLNRVIDRSRFTDFGGYVVLARTEKAECLFQTAEDKKQTGDLSGALLAYTDLVTQYSDDHQLAELARKNIQALFNEAPLTDLTSEAICDKNDALLNHNLMPQPETNLPPFYLVCAESYRQAKRYETATQVYERVINDFADTEAAQVASRSLAKTYQEWGEQLLATQQYQAALDKFDRIDELTDDAEELAAAQQGYDQALQTLSQDTGAAGMSLIKETWESVCRGGLATNPAIGWIKDEAPKAWFGGPQFQLPDALRATYPGHFRYAICIETGNETIEMCTYDIGTTSVIREQIWWQVAIRDTQTTKIINQQTFIGPPPSACPQKLQAGYDVTYSGDPPDAADIVNWLETVLSSQTQNQVSNTAGFQWPIFLSDSFDSNRNDWGTGEVNNEYATGSQQVINGKYRWEVKAKKGLHFWESPNDNSLSDFYLTVDAKRVNGPQTSLFGVVFRVTEDNAFYTFLMRDDGYFSVILLNKGETANLIDWADSSFIRPNEVNRLAVSGEGSHFKFFINDQFVGEVNDARIASGVVGLAVALNPNDESIFEFDNFELRIP